jgi:hypothetical protein
MSAVSALKQPGPGMPQKLAALRVHVSNVIKSAITKVFPKVPGFAFG